MEYLVKCRSVGGEIPRVVAVQLYIAEIKQDLPN